MDDGQFEWDDRKAAENYAKHGISFELARRAFEDPFAIEYLDAGEQYGEDRYIPLGMSKSGCSLLPLP
jgi:uncharacterized DUF497 family protein